MTRPEHGSCRRSNWLTEQSSRAPEPSCPGSISSGDRLVAERRGGLEAFARGELARRSIRGRVKIGVIGQCGFQKCSRRPAHLLDGLRPVPRGKPATEWRERVGDPADAPPGAERKIAVPTRREGMTAAPVNRARSRTQRCSWPRPCLRMSRARVWSSMAVQPRWGRSRARCPDGSRCPSCEGFSIPVGWPAGLLGTYGTAERPSRERDEAGALQPSSRRGPPLRRAASRSAGAGRELSRRERLSL
jgi:hypothetical protein